MGQKDAGLRVATPTLKAGPGPSRVRICGGGRVPRYPEPPAKKEGPGEPSKLQVTHTLVYVMPAGQRAAMVLVAMPSHKHRPPGIWPTKPTGLL